MVLLLLLLLLLLVCWCWFWLLCCFWYINATSSCRVTLAKSPLGLLKSTYVARQ